MKTNRYSFIKTSSLCALTLLTSACASRVDQNQAFEDVRAAVGGRVPDTMIWRRTSAAEAEAGAKVVELSAAELSLDAAVRIALLNNRKLQAHYADIGVAKADLVEAGLLTNPVLEIMARPTTHPAQSANLEFGLAQSVLDIFMRPARVKAANAEFEQARSEVAAMVVDTVDDVRKAYVEAVGARNAASVTQEVMAAAEVSAALAERFYAAGNVSDLQLAEEQASREDADIATEHAKLDAVKTRETLAALLNIAPEQLKLPETLPELPINDPALGDAEATALEKRLDVIARRKAVIAALDKLKLKTDWRLWQEIELKITGERDGDGQWAVGPSLALALPMFNDGGPAVARAASELLKAENELRDLEAHARADVRTALAEIAAARRIAERYRASILPLKQDIVRLKQEKYNYMLIGVFDVLVAKREEAAAALGYVDAVRDYWLARVDLARAIGGAPIETSSEGSAP